MEKRTYLTPEIELIRLDSEISLALQSVLPPEGPEELGMLKNSMELQKDVFS
ncbi:MAG: hypothetical protein RBT57_03435 [Paludibacter sp.]|jgi:hypothetical protein|nr:hypothetical protein [Paludibacter sp.]